MASSAKSRRHPIYTWLVMTRRSESPQLERARREACPYRARHMVAAWRVGWNLGTAGREAYAEMVRRSGLTPALVAALNKGAAARINYENQQRGSIDER